MRSVAHIQLIAAALILSISAHASSILTITYLNADCTGPIAAINTQQSTTQVCKSREANINPCRINNDGTTSTSVKCSDNDNPSAALSAYINERALGSFWTTASYFDKKCKDPIALAGLTIYFNHGGQCIDGVIATPGALSKCPTNDCSKDCVQISSGQCAALPRAGYAYAKFNPSIGNDTGIDPVTGQPTNSSGLIKPTGNAAKINKQGSLAFLAAVVSVVLL